MADPWRIRPARPADAPALAALEQRCFSDPWSGLAFEEMLRFPLTVALVAEEPRDAVVGYLIGRAVAGEGEILNLAVVPEQRRRGLGGRLLEAGLEALTGAGARRVWLEVRESNGGAQALYEARGFTAAGRRSRYYRQPVEDALVYQLDLAGPA
ncbi:MAG TPA: ribosomal protein S18-alanine N-acetyltransferase [Gemmatimonadales bacterium]|nr:ribosomal protein S18-alanine N-acetyltransferase [Gemmatimonadales bacterium]